MFLFKFPLGRKAKGVGKNYEQVLNIVVTYQQQKNQASDGALQLNQRLEISIIANYNLVLSYHQGRVSNVMNHWIISFTIPLHPHELNQKRNQTLVKSHAVSVE